MAIIIKACGTPFGELLLGAYDEALCLCDWRYRRQRAQVDARLQRMLEAPYVEGTNALIEEAEMQLAHYFEGTRTTFGIPLRMVGTAFQQRVWQALLAIPYGRTATYASLTGTVAEPSAIRAVASANGANALSIVVPCHRVIGHAGELVGYAGGLPAKRGLLRLERSVAGGPRPDLFSAAPGTV